MMRFPLRLTANLALAWFAPKSRSAQSAGLIQFVDAAEMLHHDSSHPVSHEKIREINSGRSPVVWMGGCEPLHHPGIAHLVRSITQTGHFVFLETDGKFLHRRIHEFQPVPRLFLTVRLESAGPPLLPSVCELAGEGLRAARLSGFLICAHARVHAETELGAMADVIQFAHSTDVDGIVITTENGVSNSTSVDAETLQQKTGEARKLIGSMWWESFSRIVEPALSSHRSAARNTKESSASFERESDADEEGVGIA